MTLRVQLLDSSTGIDVSYRYYATDRQLVYLMLVAIASHPLVQDPPIYYPSEDGRPPRPARFDKLKTHSGKELEEPGLTLAVDLDNTDNQPSLAFKPYTLGDCQPGEYLDQGTVKFRIYISIQDPTYDVPVEIPYARLAEWVARIHHSSQVFQPAPDGGLPFSNPNNPDEILVPQTLQINITPAEDLLRDWMSLLRGVIRDVRHFHPFAIRNPVVKEVHYQTSKGIGGSDPGNIVFHRARLDVECDFFEPPTAMGWNFLPLIETINLTELPPS